VTCVAWLHRLAGAMVRLLAVAALVVVTAPNVAGSSPLEPGALAFRAEAGLGGVCKPGRWMPVRIWLANDGEDVTGELVLQWGTSTLHRTVTLASPSRVHFELYIRTLEVRGTVTVRFRSRGVDIRSVDLPIRAAGPDEVVTLCVAAADPGPTDQVGCTTTLIPDALPRSMRGYDAADRVVWQSGSKDVLAADQRAALERWQSYHELEDSGLLSRAPALSATTAQPAGPRRSSRAIAIGAGVYLLALLAVGIRSRWARSRPMSAYVAVALLACIWSSASAAAGRIGPGRSVIVRHASTLRQLAGGGSYVSMHGIVEYPAFDAFSVRAGVADLSIALKSNSPSEQWYDDDGYPQISGVFGFGARQTFVLEGVVEFAPLDIVRRAGAVRVTNRSGVELGDCRFPEGFSHQRIGVLRPGQSVEARELGVIEEPFFACTLPESPVAFADARHPVLTEGASLLTVYLDPQGGARPSSR